MERPTKCNNATGGDAGVSGFLFHVNKVLTVFDSLLALFIGYPLVDFFVNNQGKAISENIQYVLEFLGSSLQTKPTFLSAG